jgi:hypothetical protein
MNPMKYIITLTLLLHTLAAVHTTYSADSSYTRMNCGGIGFSAFIRFGVGLVGGVVTAAALTIPNPTVTVTDPINYIALPMLVGAGSGLLCGTIPATVVYYYLKYKAADCVCT